jgi:hypothetical protein
MEDLPGNYIEIDAETFQRGPLNVLVRNNRIVYLDGTLPEKIVPSDAGVMCHHNDVSIVVQTNGTNWQKKVYVPN